MNDIIEVAERLYREMNPHSLQDVPSFAYERVEKWSLEWLQSKSNLTLYDWIKENKQIK